MRKIIISSLASLIGSSQLIKGPKSLREWHEQPVNLLDQSFPLDQVNVQILSPNMDRVNAKTILKIEKKTIIFYSLDTSSLFVSCR